MIIGIEISVKLNKSSFKHPTVLKSPNPHNLSF